VSPTTQRIVIGVGTLVVVVLTIVIALIASLSEQDSALLNTPTQTQTMTRIPPTNTSTLTPIPPTNTTTHTPTTIPSTNTPTPLTDTLSTPTNTPMLPPTNTATPIPPDTPTPLPTSSCSQTPVNWVMYIVERGDSWDTLSRRVNLSVFELQQANCRTDTLTPQQTLYLPFIPPTPTPTDTPAPTATPTNIPAQPPSATTTPTPMVPIIDSVTPHDGPLGETARLFVFGKNLGLLDNNQLIDGSGLQVELIQVEPSSGSVRLEIVRASSTDIEAIVPATLPEGCYNLLVVNPRNPNSRGVIKAFAYTNNNEVYPCIENATPTPVPTTAVIKLNNCTPARASINNDVEITCTGQNLRANDTSNFTVILRMGNEDVLLQLVTGTDVSFTARIPANITTGVYDLIVRNSDDQEAVKLNSFTADP